jgi:Fe-S cluster assembly iron-binding protein IscA
MLTITEGAEEALTILRDSAEDLPATGGVRITHEGTEDGEPAFAIALVAGPEADDVVLDGHALQVFVEPQAAGLLEDAALDGQAHGDHVHLGFVERDNPDGDAAP